MRVLVLDGNSLLNRAFYGIKLLSTKDGQYTNAIVGFLNILQKLRDQVEPEAIAVAFDVKAPTFRHEMYPAYKAGRKGMPPELFQQLPIVQEILLLMGLTVVEKSGYEADDILGTLAKACDEEQAEGFLATGDRDALQLVSDRVTVLLAGTKMGQPQTTLVDRAVLRDMYGLEPSQMLDLKALMGDTSDNIPGVPGVGEKTALGLLEHYGSLDAIYASLEDPQMRDSLRHKLIQGRDSAYLSRELGRICCDAPIDKTLAHYRIRPMDKEKLARLFVRLELFKLIEKWGLNAVSQSTADAAKAEDASQAKETVVDVSVSGEENADRLLEEISKAKKLYVLPEWQDGRLATLWIRTTSATAVFEEGTDAFEAVRSLLVKSDIDKYTHDVKRLQRYFMERNQTLSSCVMDTMLAGYLLNPLSSSYTLDRLFAEYAVHPVVTDRPMAGQMTAFPTLCDQMEKLIDEQGQRDLLQEMEIPLAGVLAAMEAEGFAVDKEGIADFGQMLGQRLTAIEEQIYAAVSYSFNLNSPKQLAKALFEDLGLPAKKKTKSGYSTNAEVLQSLRGAHPVVEMLLDYRMLSKLKSTYCDGLLKVIDPDGRIHSSFNQTETRTGRISSTEPNLQNIPVRQALGRELRRFFRAREGCILCDADYSQIELRVLAHMAGDATMKDAFNSGEDIHRITASQVFDVPQELVTPLMRSRAKAVNFGIVYGIGAHSLSEDIGVSFAEARQYIEGYLRHYGAVDTFMQRAIEEAKETGYARTLFNRRRPLPELRAQNAVTRSFGERVARNMPIQGTAADIIKWAMIRVSRRLEREGLKARLILQVHDELIVEAPVEEQERVCRLLKEEMEAAADLSVSLLVDVGCGKTWYDAKK